MDAIENVKRSYSKASFFIDGVALIVNYVVNDWDELESRNCAYQEKGLLDEESDNDDSELYFVE